MMLSFPAINILALVVHVAYMESGTHQTNKAAPNERAQSVDAIIGCCLFGRCSD